MPGRHISSELKSAARSKPISIAALALAAGDQSEQTTFNLAGLKQPQLCPQSRAPKRN
jgi:hypothetical protein